MKYLTGIFAITTLLTFAAAAPAEPSSPQDLARSSTPPWNGYYCGTCILTGSGGFTRELRTSVPNPKCNTLAERENYGPCFNNSCGLCVMFKYVAFFVTTSKLTFDQGTTTVKAT